MKILILGDVHGEWGDLNIVIARALRKHPDITAFVQVGDWGYAFPGTRPFKLLSSFMENDIMTLAESIPFYWLDGNHENHNQLEADGGAWQPGMIYQPRGSTRELGDKRAMFFGGASSIDKEYRIQDKSWWPQESITYRQILTTIEWNQNLKSVDIMFSHEHPIAFPYRSYKDDFGRSDKQALDALRTQFAPKFWVFGHHHIYRGGETDGTQWACAPCIEEMQAILWDGDELILLDCNKR